MVREFNKSLPSIILNEKKKTQTKPDLPVKVLILLVMSICKDYSLSSKKHSSAMEYLL